VILLKAIILTFEVQSKRTFENSLGGATYEGTHKLISNQHWEATPPVLHMTSQSSQHLHLSAELKGQVVWTSPLGVSLLLTKHQSTLMCRTDASLCTRVCVCSVCTWVCVCILGTNLCLEVTKTWQNQSPKNSL